jgi:hypothetical protein
MSFIGLITIVNNVVKTPFCRLKKMEGFAEAGLLGKLPLETKDKRELKGDGKENST